MLQIKPDIRGALLPKKLLQLLLQQLLLCPARLQELLLLLAEVLHSGQLLQLMLLLLLLQELLRLQLQLLHLLRRRAHLRLLVKLLLKVLKKLLLSLLLLLLHLQALEPPSRYASVPIHNISGRAGSVPAPRTVLRAKNQALQHTRT